MIKKVLLLIIYTSFYYSSALQLYIQSDGQNDQCENITLCANLSHYASESSHYFESNNLQLIFFPGYHYLREDIDFANLQNTVLERSSIEANYSAEIVCQGTVGFSFENITNLSLSGLTFTQCSKAHTVKYQPYYNHIRAGIFLDNVTNLSLSDVLVQNSKGYGAFLSRIYGSSNIKYSVFRNNSGPNATLNGGNAVLVYSEKSDTSANVTIERSQFLEGRSYSAASGLVILVSQCSNVHVDITESVFHDNHAESQSSCMNVSTTNRLSSGGNLAIIIDGHVHAPSIRVFKSNITQGKACFGGGIFVNINGLVSQESIQVSIIDTDLRNNSAWAGGGAVYVQLNMQSVHSSISSSTMLVQGCSFDDNKLLSSSHAGVALMLSSQSFGTQHLSPSLLLTESDFRHNKAPSSTATELVIATLYVSHIIEGLTVTNCTFEDNSVAAMLAVHSVLTFAGDIFIGNNSGYKGGGIILQVASYMMLCPNTTLIISHNHADYTGGGIYVEEECALSHDPCFYQILNRYGTDTNEILKGVKVRLIDNTASYGGDQIFGGRVLTCTTQNTDHNVFPEVFELISENSDNLSIISSEPESVHFCEDGIISTSHKNSDHRVYSGESFNISLAITGQCGGITPGTVEFTVRSDKGQTLRQISTPVMQRGCSSYSITIYTDESLVLLDISAREMCLYSTKDTGHLNLNVAMLDPPLGFVSTGTESPPYQCIQDPNIKFNESGFRCVLDETTHEAHIIRPPPLWLGFVSHNIGNESISGFVLYPFCPGEYCEYKHTNIRTDSVMIDQDSQCAQNRSGVLCGQCKPDLSLSIGSSTCLDCRNVTVMKTVGISLGLLLLGLLLVLGLLLSNLTITQGTMNEFLFYVNMVYLYWSVLQPPSKPNTVVDSKSVRVLSSLLFYFISSTNLIFGCDCCFYDGFNVIGRTWVQFIVVAYLWAIAGIIIWASRRFPRVSKLTGHNAIHVLATIFVLSHTSTSLAILHAISLAVLKYPGNNNSTKWHAVLLYDGNVPYLSGKHIPLLITSCVFAILSILFTLTLLFVQPLQRYSHLKPFRWVNKLKPLLDAYTCPHIIKPNCRFWNGYLLFMRSTLYIIFTTSLGRDYHRSLDALSIICLVLIGTSLAFGGVYTKTHLNVLSCLYILNLGVLSIIVRDLYPGRGAVSSVYFMSRSTKVVGVSLFFIGLSTSLFLCTVVYHLYKQFRNSRVPRLLKRVCSIIKSSRRKGKHVDSYQSMDSCADEANEERLLVTASSTSSDLDIHSHHPPLSMLNYREPQLMDYDSI